MLKDRITVVTGAASGIGKEVALVFLENGAGVIGVDCQYDQNALDEVGYYKVDVAKYSKCEACYKHIIEKYGHVDVLVNCAGITKDSLTSNMSEEQFDEVVSVNLKGVWNMVKLFGPHMQSRKSGSIINVSRCNCINTYIPSFVRKLPGPALCHSNHPCLGCCIICLSHIRF